MEHTYPQLSGYNKAVFTQQLALIVQTHADRFEVINGCKWIFFLFFFTEKEMQIMPDFSFCSTMSSVLGVHSRVLYAELLITVMIYFVA